MFSSTAKRFSEISRLLLPLIAFMIATLFVSVASAQESAIRFTPATNGGVSLDPGATQSYRITVENLSPVDQTYYVFSRNISGSRNGGIPVFAENANERTGMELADWITLEKTEVDIPANSKTTIGYILEVPENASPGTHLGAIFLSVEPPEIENSGAAVGYQVAHLVDVRVSGDIVEQANIRQFATEKYFHGSARVNFDVRIENTGNVLVKPRGPLEIKNMLGKQVGLLTFNESESAILPYETKTFDNIEWVGDTTGFGRYEAVLSPIYGADGARQTMSSTVTFWILPMNIIGPALGILAFVLLITFISVKLYIKRSLQHLGHGRRMVRRRKNSSGTLILVLVMLIVTALFLIVLLALFA